MNLKFLLEAYLALKTSIQPPKPERVSITLKTRKNLAPNAGYDWWTVKDAKVRSEQMVATVGFLKTGQQSRQRQAAIFARLYGGQTVMNYIGQSMNRVDPVSPLGQMRPTYNLIASVIDTLVSRLTQSRPSPTFLTDNGNYRARFLAKKLTRFVHGEFYQTKAYDKSATCLLHALDQGTGAIKVYETPDHKVGLENVLTTELYVDLEEAAHGDPRRLYQLKLIDRKVLESQFPKYKELIASAEKATLDNSSDTSKSVSDLVMVAEGWSLPSGHDTKDGMHVIACSSGELFSEKWEKPRFPFAFLHHHQRIIGFWGQGTAETLLSTQMELNSLLDTIAKSIKLVGIPRVFYNVAAKVNKASFSNKIGVLIPFHGGPENKPTYEVSACVPAELYAERDRIIQYGYQQEGLSFMNATSQKPQGLDSGEAIRSFDDITSDRFAALARRYDNLFVDLAYLVIDKAIDIATEQGSYSTVYPDKRGTETLDLPNIKILKDPFVIQCFNESSLPRDPAGRKQTIAEHVQSGMLSIQEGRRLLSFPDLEQVDTLAIAAEERVYSILDKIVEDGDYAPPDPFLPLSQAAELATSYYNLYVPRKLEEERADLLRTFVQQCQLLMQEAQQPPPQPQAAQPTASPQPTPTSPLVPNNASQAV